MGDLTRFLKKNKVEKKNTFIGATKALCDEKGEPLLWEIKPMTTKEDNAVREECTTEIQITGKPGAFRPKFNSNKYLQKVAARCVVFPNLNAVELQDSYGVKCAEDLIMEMVDDPGEYNAFMNKMQEYHGFTESLQEKVDEAKN